MTGIVHLRNLVNRRESESLAGISTSRLMIEDRLRNHGIEPDEVWDWFKARRDDCTRDAMMMWLLERDGLSPDLYYQWKKEQAAIKGMNELRKQERLRELQANGQRP